MQSNMVHSFSNIPSVNISRSQFMRPSTYKTAFDAGYIIPFFTDDVLPGDTFNVNTTFFARLNTLKYPVMDNLFIDTHYFFVPLRLVWDNARKFFGEQVNPGDSIDYTIPQFTSFTPTIESLHDYMELPINGAAMTPDSIYHRGYNFIWNEWFRDQNLQDSVVVDTDDGPDTDTDYVLLKRGKRFDYFTSCLVAPQKGDAVTLPLGTTAPINRISNAPQTKAWQPGTDSTAGINDVYTHSGLVDDSSSTVGLMIDSSDGYEADLTNATAATVNDLIEAMQIQRLLVKDARGGTRYPELVANHFGVNFYDVSYRPEFLGGGSTMIEVNTAVTTADGTSNTGDLGAYGTVYARNHGFTKSFVEHGFVMGLVSVRADLTYQQGMPRRYLRQTRYDIPWPTLAYLPEQPITNAEIYYQGTPADDDVFGYQEKDADYRYKNSSITGKLRSTYASSLDVVHLSQEFSSLPTLGPTFIEETPPLDRVVQTPTEPHIIFDSLTMMKCARALPVYGVPGLMDHL